MSVILASASAARRALLEAAGLEIEAMPAAIDEAAIKAAMLAEGARPRDIADKLAETKALKVSGRHPDRPVLGADQVLEADGRILDKPADRDAARAQLQELRGKDHVLISAAVVAIGGAPVWRHAATARLTMRAFSDRFLDRYLDAEGDLVLHSVGGYRLEGRGVQLFSRIQGDYFTILGLPLLETLDFLRIHGLIET